MDTGNVFFLEKLKLRTPDAQDAAPLNELLTQSPPLDNNSVHCNLLQCTHFAATSVAAVINDRLVGFISGYRLPHQPDTLFIWQVVVDKALRGGGVAKRMLRWLIDQPACKTITGLSTTITAGNGASWALFESFARESNLVPQRSLIFKSEDYFAGERADEYLLHIYPLPNRSKKSAGDHLRELKGASVRFMPSIKRNVE